MEEIVGFRTSFSAQTKPCIYLVVADESSIET
jgi:hypothetical protein